MSEIQKLPESLKKNGFVYELVKRTDDKCLYRKLSGERISGFEVFKTKVIKFRESMRRIAVRNKTEFDENKYSELKESFPGDEDFGKRAWYYPNLKLAEHHYEGICLTPKEQMQTKSR